MYNLLVSFVFMPLESGHFGTIQTVTDMFVTVFGQTLTKLMKGKVLRKHSLHEKTAASVLLKLFISGNE